MHITIDTEAISNAIQATNAAYDAEFETIKSDDTQCRIWINRFERMITRLRAGAFAIRMADDAALDAADDLDGMDGMGDINSGLLTAMTFESVAEHYARSIRYLDRRDQELRGVVSRDDED